MPYIDMRFTSGLRTGLLAGCLALLLWPSQGWGAVAFDNVGTGAAIGVTTVSTGAFTIGSGSDRAAAIHLNMEGTTATTITCSLGGTGGTLVSGTDTAAAQAQRTMIFAVINPPSGSQTGTCSWTNSMTAAIGAITVTGADQTTPLINGTFVTTANAGTVSVPITSTAGDLTTSNAHKNGGAPAISTDKTSRWAWASGGAGDTGPGTSNPTHVWTGNASDSIASSGANFKASGGAVGTRSVPLLGVGP